MRDVRRPAGLPAPEAGTVRLAVNRLPAKGSGRIGSLFLNPGGPGGSGVDFVAGVAEAPETKALRQHFDLVGFDPRGTNRSTPSIVCEPVARSVRRFDEALGQPAGERTAADALREGRQFAASCQQRSGKILPFMGTEYAARDMDRLRAALGDDQLSYLGLSYGTYLGAVYADMFPSRVRAVTLDGSVDPFQYGDDYLGLLGVNYRASERSVDAFLAWCGAHATTCRFGQGAAEEALDALVAHLDDQPLTTGKGDERATTNGYTVLYLLYLLTGSGRDAWPQTGKLLADIAAGKPVVTNRDLLGPAGGATNIVIECTDAAGSLVRRTSSASHAAAPRWRSGWGRPWLRAAQLRRRQRRRVQLVAAAQPAERLARRLPGAGRRPGARGGLGGRPLHAVLRCRRAGRHARQRAPAHRGRWAGCHAHVVLRQRVHPGKVADYLVR